MRRLLPMFFVLMTSAAHQANAEFRELEFLNHAILTLPEEVFADIPRERRTDLLKIASLEGGRAHLDYLNHYFRWRPGEGTEEDSIPSSSDLAVKLLPRFEDRNFPSPYSPLVFVAMDRAGTARAAPTRGQAFVLMWKDDEWLDVTDRYLPGEIDRRMHFSPYRNFAGIKVSEYHEKSEFQSTRLQHLLIWKDEKLLHKEPFPFRTDCTTDAPFDPAELATLALTPEKDSRRLMWLIVYAGIEKDERFRYLLSRGELKKDRSIALALASYEYALDRNPEPLEFITEVMKEEGGGDTNSLLVIGYMDEWDRTAEAFRNFGGSDGAAAESKHLFHEKRKFLYPEKYEKYRGRFLPQ